MSQDNENKPDDLTFDFTVSDDDQKGDSESIFAEDFNPFGDSGLSFPDEAAPLAAPTVESAPATNSVSEPIFETPDVPPMPDSFLNKEESTPDAATVSVSEKVDPKGKKKTKERKQKEKKEGSKEPLSLGSKLCLIFGLLLLVTLIAVNIFIIMFPPYKDFGVGFSSMIYYLVGMDVIAGIGIVAVPFLYNAYEKELDVFKVLLGISAMALSFGVILLMTAYLRYDFLSKPTSPLPTLVAPMLNPEVPAAP